MGFLPSLFPSSLHKSRRPAKDGGFYDKPGGSRPARLGWGDLVHFAVADFLKALVEALDDVRMLIRDVF